jgi:Tfp pilus assembly protein PilX
MRTPTRQSGATLLVAMIMLVLITLLVINTVNLGSGSVQTVSNMQFKNQAAAAAEETLQDVISNKRFFETPSTVFTVPCEGSYNKKCIDTNNDQVVDVVVTLKQDPTCVRAKAVNNRELLMSDEEDRKCSIQADQSGFGQDRPGDPSLCAQSVWEIQAQADDRITQASADARQGVAVIVPTDAINTSCPL